MENKLTNNEKWLKMLNNINYPINEFLKTGELLHHETSNNLCVIDVQFGYITEYQIIKSCMDAFKEFMNKRFNLFVSFNVSYVNSNIQNKLIDDYFIHGIEELKNEKPDITILNNYKRVINGNNIIISVGSSNEQHVVNSLTSYIVRFFKRYGIDINVESNVSNEIDSITEQRDKSFFTLDGQNTAKANEQYYQRAADAQANNEEAEYSYYKKNSIIPLSLINIPFTSMELSEFEQLNGTRSVMVQGVIIKSEFKSGKTKTGNNYCLYTGVITDYKDSITIKKFLNANENQSELESNLVVGKKLKIVGRMEYDNFSKCVTVMANKITVMGLDNSRMRFDGSEAKRVELHAHTKMSVLDSILSVEEYVEQAANYGHKAIAVTDHENCHVLPTFFKLCKKKKIKPIAGVEVNFVDLEKSKIALTTEDIDLSKATYVIFDLETTGFSVNFDDIIEIGAIKVSGGIIIDKFSTFVKPKKQISEYISNLTDITNDDVYAAPYIENILPEFKKFIDGCILVGHNAKFDTGFIYYNMKKMGIFEHPYPCIDTIQIARVLYSEKGLKKFNLAACGKFLHVDIEQQHRAIYDAITTNNVFQRMIGDIQSLNIYNYKDLNSLIDETKIFKYIIPTHLNILVKNRDGLKNFYKLISDSQTTHFYKSARVTLDVLNKYREGCLIGSGCVNSDVFKTAYEKDPADLEKVMEKYDFIEVQPISCYTFLNEHVQDPNGIKYIEETIKLIISTAKKMGKLVCATGDVHELLKEDGEFRKIYLSVNRPNGGGPHELDGYKDDLDCHYRSTSEMIDEFSFLNDRALIFDIVVKNTNIINDMIEEYDLFPHELFIPKDDFLSSSGVPSMKQAIIDLANDTAHEMYGEVIPQYVEDRKTRELDAIISHGYFSVYYISHLLVKNSNDHGYIVGSRGSVGSSFAATLLKITEVNSLNPHYLCPKCHFSAFKFDDDEKKKYPQPDVPQYILDNLEKVNNGFDLPECNCPRCNTLMKRLGMSIAFETFLGFTGEKVPDIDLNFSGEYQPQAHLFVQEMFGHEYAFRAGTVSEVADKTAFAYVRDYYSKKGIDKRQAEMERLAQFLMGSKKTTGQHPGGIVVVPNYIEIFDVTPIQYPPIKDSDNMDDLNWRTTHFDYHSFEDNLLKLDILGHDDPTLLKRLMDIVHERPDEFNFYDVDDMPIIDNKILSLFSSKEVLNIHGEDLDTFSSGTLGIPEFGTDFVRGMLETIKPATYNDIIKVSGLSHGTNVWQGNAEDLIKHVVPGFPEIKFEEVIGCRDDIMIYLIKMGVPAATAFATMEAVRKGKNIPKENIPILKEHNIPEWYFWTCERIKYLFPKAHASAYVINACRICWFKIYKPIYYYSVYFSVRAKGYDAEIFALGKNAIKNKIQELRSKKDLKADEEDLLKELPLALEMVLRGYSFRQINIEKSDALNFVPAEDGVSIYLPFVTIPSLGDAVAKSIIDARNDRPFLSKADFLRRTSVNKTQYAKLSALGVFDNLPDDDPDRLF